MQEKEQPRQIIERINTIITKLLNRFGNQKLKSQEFVDDFTVYIQQLGDLRDLLNSMQKYSELQTKIQKAEFFKSSKSLQTYASSLQRKDFNTKWYVKSLKIIQDFLTQILSHEDQETDKIYARMHNVRVFLRILEYIVTFDENDLFNLNQDHPKWQAVKSVTTISRLSPPPQMSKSRQKLKNAMLEAGAMVHYASDIKTKIGKTLASILCKIKLAFKPDHSLKAHAQFKNNITTEKARAFLGGMEIGLTGFFLKLALPYIKYHKIIYITPSSPKLTGTCVLKWLRKETKTYQLQQTSETNQKLASHINLKQKHKIEVFINSPIALQRRNTYTGDEPDDLKTIILQLHGGGWVAMSPVCHQSYLRQWANLTGAPVFSPNYQKAPQNPFPCGLNDCWQTYNWLLTESHKYYKIKKDKEIIICGDSAGGNLSFALTTLILDQGLKPPCCLAGFYPALTHAGSNKFTPSHLNSLRDPMLSYDFRQFCADSYVGNQEFDVDENYLLSPLFTPDRLLKEYPQTAIYVGEVDPLHDDALRFALRMNESGSRSKFKAIIYEGMTHLFLNLDIPIMGLPQSRTCILDSATLFSQVIESIK